MKKNRILLICEPNIGILENVLPLCRELLKENFKFDLLFLKRQVITQVNKQSFTNNETIKIFDNYFLYDESLLYKFQNFNQILQITKKFFLLKFLYFFLKLLPENLFRFFYEFINNFNFFLKKFFLKKYIISNDELKKYDLIFYDIQEIKKKNFYKFSKNILNNKKISFFHGSAFNYYSIKKKFNNFLINNTYVFKFTRIKEEFFFYRDYVKEYNIFNTGNPKHDKNWLNYITKIKKKDDFIDNQTILFISRSINNYYTRSDRLKTINMLNDLLVKYSNLKLAIKLHPKENSDLSKEIYFKILGKNFFNKKWAFTDTNPIIAGKNSKFIITIFSGLAVDMILLKKPVIELLNLNNKKIDKKDIFLDKNNNKVFGLRYYNLVYGASNKKELNYHVEFIMNNYKKSIDKLNNNYQKYFISKNTILNSKKIILDLISQQSRKYG